MRLIKKSMAFALVAAMVVTMAPADMADAAKKVKLNKKTASIEVGQTVKIKVKNAKKSAKVTWKSSKKKVANIKKSTKKGNAYANVVGVKAGKSTITATYKVGKKKAQKLTCKVTVTDKVAPTPSGTPVVTASPTAPAQPTQNVPTPTPAPTPTRTPRPTPTPSPVPTPTPTPLPIQEYNFEKVTNGIAIDVSTYQSIGGSGSYNSQKKYVEINDTSAADNSQGTWALPESVPTINLGDVVKFRVQGYNYGTSGFRFWIGTGTSGCCTPVLLGDEIDENLKIGESGYPEVITVEEDGAEVTKTMNQMAINYVDKDKKAFDMTFTFKSGTSQNDTDGACPNFTLKYIMGGDTSGYINGLCIKNIYYITGDEPSVTDEPGTTDAPTTTPTPVPDFAATKISTEINVDGKADDAAWADVPELPIAYKVKYSENGDTTTNATAKIAWDENNLYGLVKVADADVDDSAGASHERDGVEFFLDEDYSMEAKDDKDNNTDAFQYRLTGLKTEGKLTDEITTNVGAANTAKTDYKDIATAYELTEDGYTVEFKIPFKTPKTAGTLVGFDIIVQACSGGARDAEIYLRNTDKALSYWNLDATFATLKLVAAGADDAQ